MSALLNTMSISDKISHFTNEITQICREFKVAIDVGSDDKNCLRFYFKRNKSLTLKDLMLNKNKYAALLDKIGNLFTSTGFIIDSGDYTDGCPMVIRNVKTRAVLGFLDYSYTDDEEFILYRSRKK